MSEQTVIADRTLHRVNDTMECARISFGDLDSILFVIARDQDTPKHIKDLAKLGRLVIESQGCELEDEIAILMPAGGQENG